MSAAFTPETPILVGSGQYVDREPPQPGRSLSPVDMNAEAARRALADCGAGGDFAATIDVLAVARLFEHSVKDRVMWPNPFGCSDNMPGSVAQRLAIKPRRLVYAEVGGETPQRLVNQMAEAIHAGEIRSALLTGAEALATIRHAQRAGIEFDWREECGGDYEDLWPDTLMATEHEIAHGIAFPINVYALFEQVRRQRLGLDDAAYRRAIGELFAPFSEVAAANEYAQFPLARGVDEIAEASAENFVLCRPYSKWMVAQDAVNQGAAVVMTSVAVAREAGIPESHWITLPAYADVDELTVSQREDLSRSHAQGLALDRVLDDAGIGVDDIDLIDFYSCFPVAVFSAADQLGLPTDGSRPLTLTGGLPFFGGPGNNYSLHAIAEVVQQLRGRPSGNALVAANGGYLSKHSVGLYSRAPAAPWQPRSSAREQAAVNAGATLVVAEEANGTATVETYAAVYRRGEPDGGFVVATMADGARCVAVPGPGDADGLATLFGDDVIGRTISVRHEDGFNRFTFA